MRKQRKLPVAIRELYQKLTLKDDGGGAQGQYENTATRDYGWGGRIRTHEWRDQNPLPYRLATPQSQKSPEKPKPEQIKQEVLSRLIKNTITRLKAVLVLSIFLCSSAFALRDSPSQNYKIRLLQENNLGSSINHARFFKQGVIYTSQEQLYFNDQKINILGQDEDYQINNIQIHKNQFFISSSLGLLQNYRRIFSKEECYHSEIGKSKIFLACDSGIYEANYQHKQLQANFAWKILPLSPMAVNFFTLNKSKTQIEYATNPLGFHHYDARKQQWQKNNLGLKRDFQDSYGFGRFLVERNKNTEDRIHLSTSSGVYLSTNKGKTWLSYKQGIESNPDGFYTIRDIKLVNGEIWAITSTGLYQFKESWHKIPLRNSLANEHNQEDIFSIDTFKTKNSFKILVSTSQGQIFQLENQANFQQAHIKKNFEPIPQLNIKQTIDEILASEPKIKDLHKKVLSFAGIPSGKKFRSYKMQARLRNLLPSFKTNTGKNQQGILTIERRNEDSYNSNTSSLNTAADLYNTNRNDSTHSRSLNFDWKLGNIIYDPEIHSINTSARITANIRENILTEVTQIYFQRKEVLIELLKDSLNQDLGQLNPNFFKQKINLEQYTAQLDARTGSWFSETLQTKLSEKLEKLSSSMSPILIKNIKEIYSEV